MSNRGSAGRRARGSPRLPRLVFLGCALGVIACSDSTGPGPTPVVPVPPAPGSPLAVAAGLLEDITAVFLPAITNQANQTSARTAIRSLSSNILAGEYAKAWTDLATGRGILAGLDAVQTVELAPVGLAFDYVDVTLTAAGK